MARKEYMENSFKKGMPSKRYFNVRRSGGGQKKYENSTSKKKMTKNDLVVLLALRERRILRRKLGNIKKFPKNSLKN